MPDQDTIRTERLLLRPFDDKDVAVVCELAGDRRIAEMTARIPHPYPSADAEEFFRGLRQGFVDGKSINLAITLEATNELIGAIGLEGLDHPSRRAELGYWIGVPHWGNGYATEAARALIDFAFRRLDLNRIHAHHFARNPASGRVLTKCGMRREGVMRQHFRKGDRFEDCVLYAILRQDWARRGDVAR
jgi:RimJ/RimL family protein N-acetyltransferase